MELAPDALALGVIRAVLAAILTAVLTAVARDSGDKVTT
jgi:hypothetical protein